MAAEGQHHPRPLALLARVLGRLRSGPGGRLGATGVGRAVEPGGMAACAGGARCRKGDQLNSNTTRVFWGCEPRFDLGDFAMVVFPVCRLDIGRQEKAEASRL